jgi:hypothetical protein
VIGKGHENFARRSFLNRSFAVLLSSSIGSDKPFKHERDG